MHEALELPLDRIEGRVQLPLVAGEPPCPLAEPVELIRPCSPPGCPGPLRFQPSHRIGCWDCFRLLSSRD